MVQVHGSPRRGHYDAHAFLPSTETAWSGNALRASVTSRAFAPARTGSTSAPDAVRRTSATRGSATNHRAKAGRPSPRAMRVPTCPHAGQAPSAICSARTSVRSRKKTVPAQPSPVHRTSAYSSTSINSAAAVVCHPYVAAADALEPDRPRARRRPGAAERVGDVETEFRQAGRHAVGRFTEHDHQSQRRPPALAQRCQYRVFRTGQHVHVVTRRGGRVVDHGQRNPGAARATAEFPRFDPRAGATDQRHGLVPTDAETPQPLRTEPGQAHEVPGRRSDRHAVGVEEVDWPVYRLDGREIGRPATPRGRPRRAEPHVGGAGTHQLGAGGPHHPVVAVPDFGERHWRDPPQIGQRAQAAAVDRRRVNSRRAACACGYNSRRTYARPPDRGASTGRGAKPRTTTLPGGCQCEVMAHGDGIFINNMCGELTFL